MWKTEWIVVLGLVHLLVLCKGEVGEEGRHFHGYYPSEEEKSQAFPYPPANYPLADDYAECARNPLLPLLGRGMNLILLKLGALGILKAITSVAVLGFLVKIPLLLLKLAFLKSFFLPLFAAPFLVHVLTNQMSQSGEGGNEKPGETETPEMGGMGRELTSAGWRGLRMFVESEQCAERISCIIGASYKDSSVGSIFSRMLKYFHRSSPPFWRERMTLIRDAFDKGIGTSTCAAEEYKCQSPALVIQQGAEKIRLL